jgi:hypothetical protein
MNCPTCLEVLYKSNVASPPQKEEEENAQLFLKTCELMDQVDKQVITDILGMVVKFADKVLELVSTTGTILQNLQPEPARSSFNDEQQTGSRIRILQETEKSPYSIQASLLSKDEHVIILTVSIYHQELDKFVEGITATIITPSMKTALVTDNNGEIVCQITESGVHEITLTFANNVIGKIRLTTT